jgi:FkbM family methyltransferase
MKRADRIKIDFIRNWNLPGKERLAHWFKPSAGLKKSFANGIIWLSTEDICIYTTADNYIEHTILTTGTYEDEINKLIRASLKPGYVALDIGGNIGLQSIRMSQCCGNEGLVYAFEPLKHIQQKFAKNIMLNNCSNVTLFPFALSNTAGSIAVKIDEQVWNQGTFSLNQTNGGQTLQQIEIKTGDTLPEIQNLTRLDLIKIDVEGFELQVLQGLADTLAKHKPRIIFEYDINYWASTKQLIADGYNFLNSLGYTLYQVTSIGCQLITNHTAITSGNLFCIATPANG